MTAAFPPQIRLETAIFHKHHQRHFAVRSLFFSIVAAFILHAADATLEAIRQAGSDGFVVSADLTEP
ncbi:hypothetical protein [Nguyenibacter vanlangensis]|uniref:Uncharacterized protein n=1 Tax=Nguyenibacter vanlangensis TaxID=1216886 RepID=A0A7Y7M6V3_9PROT|nr:hypothetical protein [Nguyenibacter vanlangensis]NVN11156.1 hypothetical protein [Nguyenibacter vanlangensis]